MHISLNIKKKFSFEHSCLFQCKKKNHDHLHIQGHLKREVNVFLLPERGATLLYSTPVYPTLLYSTPLYSTLLYPTLTYWAEYCEFCQRSITKIPSQCNKEAESCWIYSNRWVFGYSRSKY